MLALYFVVPKLVAPGALALPIRHTSCLLPISKLVVAIAGHNLPSSHIDFDRAQFTHYHQALCHNLASSL